MHFSLSGELVRHPVVLKEISCTGFPTLRFLGDICPKITVSLVCLFSFSC